MSEIQTELDRIISQVEEGHSKATAKGATPQSSKTLANLLTAIDTIPEATEPTLQSKSVTPSKSAQTVKPDSGYDGLSQVTVDGDADLKAENIKKGVNIFGVVGTLVAESGGESSGYQVATGVFNVASQVSEANATAATVTGIPFKPRMLLIQKAGSVSISISSIGKNKYYFCGYEQYADDDIYYQYVNYTGSSASRARANSTSTIYKIEVSEDGFILKRGTSSSTTYHYYIGTGDYTYVAIS